ncbi:MAG: TetR/AcrR family transcriptional regulator [Pseudomonadota bacterium]
MARTAGSTGEKTSLAIQRAAVRLFAERGYAAVSMRAIAEDVGIQVGALYNHFSTKQDVLVQVLLVHMRDLIEKWETIYDANGQPQDVLEKLVRFHVRYHMDRHNEVFISFMELRSLEPENFSKVEAIRQRYEHQVRDVLERGRVLGAFALEDAHVSAMALIAMMTGVTNWYKPDGRLSGDEIEEIYVAKAFRSVGLPVTHDVQERRAG